MSKIWNETSGANRLIMLGVAAGVLVIVVGGLVMGSRLLSPDDPSKHIDGENETALVEQQVISPTTIAIPQVTAPPVTYPNGMTQYQIEHPESSVLDAYQLAYKFNQKNSGLSVRSYQVATDVASRVSEATATGKGISDFQSYFDQKAVEAWVTDYKLIYATVSATDDDTILKARVWFTGKEKISGRPMAQVQYTFLLTRPSKDNLDIQPYFVEQFYDDDELGITVFS